MSLDLSLICAHCKTSVGDFNYTYNCSAMWKHIYPDSIGMVDIDGLTGAASKSRLEHAIHCMDADPAIFKLMNPPNGWGTSSGFCTFLSDLQKAAKEYPDCVWEACR